MRAHEPSSSTKRPSDGAGARLGEGSSKRVKFGTVSTSRPSSSTHKGDADLANEGALSRGQVHTFTSCLEAGLVKDDEARRLHHVYWSGADQYLSVFDPSQDTYEK